jgi:predicted NBD/HSP70 family sugar kinase
MLGCPVAVENDAKAAGLSEALLITNEFKHILYVTIGTGIGIAYIANGILDTSYGDRGGKAIMLKHYGELKEWESFASGRAIAKRFGKKASDITDPKDWQEIAHDIAQGLNDLIGLFEPDVIVIGGGIGTHFDKYKEFLETDLTKSKSGLKPALRQAKRPEEAVVYGCLELARQQDANPA